MRFVTRPLPVLLALLALLVVGVARPGAGPTAFADHDEARVPDVVARTPEEARVAVEAAGLVPVLVPVAGPPPGRVERQEPLAGTPVAVGSQVLVRYGIALRVETRVPDLRGKRMADVGAELEGVYTLEVELIHQPNLPDGQVLDQLPAPGQSLWYRGVLALKVAAVAPEQGGSAIVPPLVGLSEAEALDMLRSLGLNVAVDHRLEPGQPDGTVLAQDPRSGAEIVTGGTVYLRVSGPGGSHGHDAHPVPVPGLLGLEMNAALGTLQAAGFVPQLSFQVQAGQPAWRVMAQDPAPGTPRPAGANVALVVALPAPQPAQVALPSFFGLTQQHAQAILHSLGLAANVQLKNVGFPAGRVYSQSPAAGSLVPKGSMVILSVALGQPGPGLPNVQVPPLVGLSPAQAWHKLAAAGLTPKGQQSLAPGQPVDVVLAQLPAPGTLVPMGAEVRFTTPLASIVPNLFGRTRTQAIQLLQAEGFNADPQGPAFGVGPTAVIAQSQPAGVALARGTTVAFAYKFQAGGGMPVKVQVPALQGLTKDQAAQALQQKGLGVDLVRQGPILPGPGTKVVGTVPTAGVLVPAAAVVKVIYVEVGGVVQPVQVPQLQGKSLAEAQQMLAGLGLQIDAILQGPNLPAGLKKVVGQQPAPGTPVAPGSVVKVVYVEQAQIVVPVTVPSLVGKTKAQAKAALDALGLVAKFNGPGGNPNKLKVLTQQPAAGTKLAPGSSVTMFVLQMP